MNEIREHGTKYDDYYSSNINSITYIFRGLDKTLNEIRDHGTKYDDYYSSNINSIIYLED